MHWGEQFEMSIGMKAFGMYESRDEHFGVACTR